MDHMIEIRPEDGHTNAPVKANSMQLNVVICVCLQILGEGDLIAPLKIKAVQFSGQAREKIEKAGGTIEEVPAKIRWTKQVGKDRKEAQMAAKAAAKPAAKPAPKSAKK